jgi:DNA-directed RNA polymerase specialized sigma24 family protein
MEAVQVLPPEPPLDATGDTPRPVAELGDDDFVACYKTSYHRLVRALRLAGASPTAAEDAAQEAFARAFVHWHRVRRGPNPVGYVYTAGFRLLAKAQRKESRFPGTNKAVDPGSAGDPTQLAATTTVAIGSALAAMPRRRRACAVMCLVVGLPVHEAAVALGIADGTVRKHLEEARRDLAAVLA